MKRLTRLPCDQQRWRQHQQPRISVHHIDRVQQMALKSLPHPQLLVQPQRDDVAGRTDQRHNRIIVRLDFVHARAGYQIPHAQQPVLRARTARSRLVRVDKHTGDGPIVAVQRVQQAGALQPKHLECVVLAAGQHSVAHNFETCDGLLMALQLGFEDAAQLFGQMAAGVLGLWGQGAVETARRAGPDVSWSGKDKINE
jgi:hypothetical protein